MSEDLHKNINCRCRRIARIKIYLFDTLPSACTYKDASKMVVVIVTHPLTYRDAVFFYSMMEFNETWSKAPLTIILQVI